MDAALHERRVLVALLDRLQSRFGQDPGAARELLAQGVGGAFVGREAEVAAYAGVASLVLNLDETVTRE